MKWKTMLFDCDGVVLQSNELKTQAFREALNGEDGALVDAFITYHKENGGISRFEKFRYFFSEIKKTPQPESAIALAIEKYGEIIRRRLLACPPIPGVVGFLEAIQGKCNVFLVSGGAELELRDVLEQREYSKYFSGIFGSPKTKHEILYALQKEGKLFSPRIFFGDSALDLKVAQEFECTFFFVKAFSEWKEGQVYCSKNQIPVIAHFKDPELWQCLNSSAHAKE